MMVFIKQLIEFEKCEKTLKKTMSIGNLLTLEFDREKKKN